MRIAAACALLFIGACGLDALGTGAVDGDGGASSSGGGGDAATGTDGLTDDGGGPAIDGGGSGDGSNDGSTATGRVPGAVALYGFNEGDGGVVRDVSGVAPALDLTIEGGGSTHWIPGALAVDGPSLLDSAAAAKIVAACKASNEITVEAWLKPANTTQNIARIAGITSGVANPVVSLSAAGKDYLLRVRTSTQVLDGDNDIFTDGGVAVKVQHVVATRRANGQHRGYVDGKVLVESATGGDFSTWTNLAIAVANEQTSDRPWVGEIHLVAFYARALTDVEVKQNFVAGP